MSDRDDDPKRRRAEGGADDGFDQARSREFVSDREVIGSSSADLSAYGTTAYADRAPSRPAKRRAPPGITPPSPRPAYEPPRRRIAPWIASALLLLVLSMLVARRANRSEGERVEIAAGDVGRMNGSLAKSRAGAGAAAATQRFLTWVDRRATRAAAAESEATHPLTSEGLRFLADALRAAASPTIADAERRAIEMRAYADRLEETSAVDHHAEYAHAAFADAAHLLSEMHRGPDLQSAADAVRADQPLSAQGDQVRAFFRQAAMALR